MSPGSTCTISHIHTRFIYVSHQSIMHSLQMSKPYTFLLPTMLISNKKLKLHVNATLISVISSTERTVITDKPEHYEVAAGSSATFRCNANTDELLHLEMIWLNDGQQIDFENQPRFRMTDDYSLYISDTSELDSGEYTCIARTEIDEARAQATLTVQGNSSIRSRLVHSYS